MPRKTQYATHARLDKRGLFRGAGGAELEDVEIPFEIFSAELNDSAIIENKEQFCAFAARHFRACKTSIDPAEIWAWLVEETIPPHYCKRNGGVRGVKFEESLIYG